MDAAVSPRMNGLPPTIVCTDNGFDPADGLALVRAAPAPPLRPVVTSSDEFGGGQRARLAARHEEGEPK